MTRLGPRTSLRVALALSAGTAASASWGAALAAEPACAPAVEGPPAVVSAIAERARTIPSDSCRAVTARVRAEGSALWVERLEQGLVVTSRRVEDPETAVTLVLSWARVAWVANKPSPPADAAVSVQIAVEGPSPPAPEAAPPAAGPPMAVVVPVVAPPSSAPRQSGSASAPEPGLERAAASDGPRFAALARIGLSLASDASLWADATLGACGFVGPVCLGGYVRAPFDVLATGPARDLDTSRGGVDGLLGVDIPIALGRLAFRPGLAAGAGWLRASVLSNDSLVVRDVAVARVSAFARLGVRLVGPTWIEVGALADLAPNAPVRGERNGDVNLPGFPLFRTGFDGSFRLEVP